MRMGVLLSRTLTRSMLFHSLPTHETRCCRVLAERCSLGTRRPVNVALRVDTPIEVDYYVHGGSLPYVLR